MKTPKKFWHISESSWSQLTPCQISKSFNKKCHSCQKLIVLKILQKLGHNGNKIMSYLKTFVFNWKRGSIWFFWHAHCIDSYMTIRFFCIILKSWISINKNETLGSGGGCNISVVEFSPYVRGFIIIMIKKFMTLTLYMTN